MSAKYKTAEEVHARGCALIGIPFKDVDTTGRLKTGKGAVGTMIEESWFGLRVNSESRPDFPEAGVELKVTPYVKHSKGISAKERLVCNIIDYMEEYKRTFTTSSFYTKCNRMLILIYEHVYGVSKGEYAIEKALLFQFPEEDLKIIQSDWETIVGKIKAGKAHEISEGDTFYLGACTKGASSKSVREQPFSPLMAKQRAFSLKQSYMTYILRNYAFGSKTHERILKDSDVSGRFSFVSYIQNLFAPYFGKTQAELKKELGIGGSPKNLNGMIVSRILRVQKVNQTEEFQKANVKLKTVRLEADGKPIEQNMSFPAFRFKDLVELPWEESAAYAMTQQKYMFVLFKKDAKCNDDKKNGAHTEQHITLDSVFFWQLNEKDVDEVYTVWKKAVEVVKRGPELIPEAQEDGKIVVYNDLPKESQNRVAHVRPHSQKAAYRTKNLHIGKRSDGNLLPNGELMTTQCFWFNRRFIQDEIARLRNSDA